MLRAKGWVWHKEDKEAGVVPDGWIFGWKPHLATTVAAMWIPLVARLVPAKVANNRMAPLLIEALPMEARFVFGDSHYDAPNARLASHISP